MTCGCDLEGCLEEQCDEPPMPGSDICLLCSGGEHL